MNYFEECLYHFQHLQELLEREEELFGQMQKFENDMKYRQMLEREQRSVKEQRQQLRQLR